MKKLLTIVLFIIVVDVYYLTEILIAADKGLTNYHHIIVYIGSIHLPPILSIEEKALTILMSMIPIFIITVIFSKLERK